MGPSPRCWAVALLLGVTACAGSPSASRPPSVLPSPSAAPASASAGAPAGASPSAPAGASAGAASGASRPGRPLTGKTIVLDPGHNALNGSQPARANAPVPAGGFTKPCNTSGTSTDDGYPEHAYTWDVAVRAAALLRAQGARVVLTRPDDRGFGPCVNVRAAIANRNHAAATVSIHADGAVASGFGFHVIEPGVAPDGGNRAIVAPSDVLARRLRAAFRAATGEPYATYLAGGTGLDRRTDLAGLNLARVPAVFVECGNMRNVADARRLRSAAFRQSAAVGVTRALVAFLTAP